MGVETEPVEGACVATGVGDGTVAEGVTEGAAPIVGDAGGAPTDDAEGADPQPASRMTANGKASRAERTPARRRRSPGFMAWNPHPGW